jgi:RNA polymerase sigma-70 factor (ECF subfamily)
VVTERSDEELLRSIAVQDTAALEALYSRYGGLTFSLALRITGSRETAEEVVQESFLSAWNRGTTYRPDRGSARAWLLSIVHHRAIDVVRARNARGVPVVLDEEAPFPAPDDIWRDVEQTLDREAIGKALVALPNEQRESILLAYFAGFSYPEISERLGVPLGTVKSRMRLGLEKLRILMAEPSGSGISPS